MQSCAPSLTNCICNHQKKRNNLKLRLEKEWITISGGTKNIVCISLQDRNDRWRAVSERFHSYGLCRLVKFYRPCKPDAMLLEKKGIKSGGAYGCWTSHQFVAQEFLNHQKKRGIVFEDDVDFLPAAARDLDLVPTTKDLKTFYKHLCNISTIIQKKQLPEQWDVFYLGHFPYPLLVWPINISPVIFKTHSALMHAYIFSREGMNKVSKSDFCLFKQQNNDQEDGIDIWVSLNTNQYATFPQIAVQSQSKSSNFVQRSSVLTQTMADGFYPAAIQFHRRHTFVVEIFSFFIAPIVALVLILLVFYLFYRLLFL
jgi:hypothetical protein